MTAVVHDHFVLLLEKEEFENPPSWLTQNFNIINGGTHAGGSSRNKLIVFKDGTYLELFNWINKPVEFLAWANKKPGLIDFAVTTLSPVTPDQNFDTVQKNLSKISADSQLGVTYATPLAGGRQRADGIDVKWKNSRPQFQATNATPDPVYFPDGRIDVPFFCHDVTERTVRVPFDKDEITTHPCGAIGTDRVEVLVPASHIGAYLKLYGAVLDVEKPEQSSRKNREDVARFQIGVPHPVSDQPTYVQVCPVKDQDNNNNMLRERGIGIAGLILRTARSTSDVDEIKSLGADTIGKTIKLKD